MRACHVALAGAIALAGLAACHGVIAPAPPAESADTQMVRQFGGDRRVIAPKAARQLREAGFTTRSFRTDSLWGWRAQEKISARLRYAAGTTDDSTRVLIELWGPCPQGVRRPCLAREAASILAGLLTDEPVPQ